MRVEFHKYTVLYHEDRVFHKEKDQLVISNLLSINKLIPNATVEQTVHWSIEQPPLLILLDLNQEPVHERFKKQYAPRNIF